MSTLQLYGTAPTRAIRALWLLNELDLPCEIHVVDLPKGAHRKPEFLALNPFGKIPVLVDGPVRLAESMAIALYLAEVHGQGRFIPASPAERGEMHQSLFFLASEIEAPLWRMALHESIYPEAERSPAEVERARRDCARMLEPLAGLLADREVLVGSSLSVADFMAAYTLDWAEVQGLLDPHPGLKAYVGRLYARPAAPPRIAEAFAQFRKGEVPGRWRHPR